MRINYSHAVNRHTLAGPQAALPFFFEKGLPESLLDVGCGTGTWLKAVAELGIADYQGVDGVEIPPEQLFFESGRFHLQDLTKAWDLGRRFSVVLCLEVAEHLEEAQAEILIDSLVRHSDVIIFSAACPGQSGQHHVNCQWPAYWQKLFNLRGYSCDDALRRKIWEVEVIEPWYRQNLFVARRVPDAVRDEARLLPVIHPKMVPFMMKDHGEKVRAETFLDVTQGHFSLFWYLKLPFQALQKKIVRKLGGAKSP